MDKSSGDDECTEACDAPDPSMRRLVDVRLRPIPQVVWLLRDLLARAQTGEIQSVAVATEADQSSITTGFAGDIDVWRLVGAMEELKLRLLARPTVDDVVLKEED